MSNGAVNIMLGSLPEKYPVPNRNFARRAFFPSGLPKLKNIVGLNNNNNNRTRNNKTRNKITRNLIKAAANMEAEVRRQALVNQRYGPKFRVPRVPSVTPSGPNNIFPDLADPVGYNSNASYASDPRTGIIEPVVRNVKKVQQYIKKGPRTVLNPEWVRLNPIFTGGPQNLMGRQGPIIPWNRFGPRTRKTRR